MERRVDKEDEGKARLKNATLRRKDKAADAEWVQGNYGMNCVRVFVVLMLVLVMLVGAEWHSIGC